MTVEFARNRVVKMRNDHSRNDLNNRLGFNNKENRTNDIYASWIEVR